MLQLKVATVAVEMFGIGGPPAVGEAWSFEPISEKRLIGSPSIFTLPDQAWAYSLPVFTDVMMFFFGAQPASLPEHFV